jgi:hypothetical protein
MDDGRAPGEVRFSSRAPMEKNPPKATSNICAAPLQQGREKNTGSCYEGCNSRLFNSAWSDE